MCARTNVDVDASPALRQAWLAWAHATTTSLEVGFRPVGVDQPLSALLGPRTFGNMCGQPQNDGIDGELEEIAKAIYERCTRTEPMNASMVPERGPFRD